MGDVFDQLDTKQGDVFDTATAAPDTRSLLDHLANDPNNIPLDSTLHATEHGIASIGQGVAQAVQGVGNLVRHPIDSIKGAPSAVAALPSQAAALAKDPPTLAQVGDVAGQTAGNIIAGEAMAKVPGAVAKIPYVGRSAITTAKTLADVPAAVSADTSSALAKVGDDAGLAPLQSTTAREAAAELQQNFINKAKEYYSPVDKAVGGDLKPVQEKIAALKKAVKVQANVNPDLAEKYMDDLATQQQTLAGLIEKAKANGVPNAEQLMQQGDQFYRRGMAMDKVTKGIKTASGVVKSGGHPNPVLFANQVDRLFNTKTLQTALGDEGAAALQDVAKKGLSRAKTVSTVKKMALVGAGAGLYEAGRSGAASVLSGQGN